MKKILNRFLETPKEDKKKPIGDKKLSVVCAGGDQAMNNRLAGRGAGLDKSPDEVKLGK